MKKLRNFFILLVMVIALAVAPGASYALNILLTNDDGWEMRPGVPTPVQALYGALIGAGYQVTCVVPAVNQSGTGGSLNTNVGTTVAITQNSSGAYQVPSTPTDCVRAAVGVLGVQPDLVISGPNFGQNIGMQTSSASGTVNAAILGAYRGIPSIAVSIGLNLAENPYFQSTFAAYQPAAAFVVKLVQMLEGKACHGGLLPEGTLLNINIPVPYEGIQGIAFTRLAVESALDFVWVPAGPGRAMILTKTQTGGVPEEIGSDQYYYDKGKISISVLDPDMTADLKAYLPVKLRLWELKP